MSTDLPRRSRRGFVADLGGLASTVALAGCATGAAASPAVAPGPWDLGWVDRVARATDRAVFDWPALGDPADATIPQLADRYLGSCAAAYGSRRYTTAVVLNVRTQAVPAALGDALWARYDLGAEYKVSDPNTRQPATRNPFWHDVPDPAPGVRLPTLRGLVERQAIVLVCDFALGHLARRLAAKRGVAADTVHQELRGGFVPGAVAVPSGIFGLARAQNSGCAVIHV